MYITVMPRLHTRASHLWYKPFVWEVNLFRTSDWFLACQSKLYLVQTTNTPCSERFRSWVQAYGGDVIRLSEGASLPLPPWSTPDLAREASFRRLAVNCSDSLSFDLCFTETCRITIYKNGKETLPTNCHH